MGRSGREPVVPGLSSTPGWKVGGGSAFSQNSGNEGSSLDWEPDVAVDLSQEELAEVDQEANASLIVEEEFQQWTSQQAVAWIANAGNAFEVLGFRAVPLDASGAARRRYLRLSLLTHPDKCQEPEAGPAFQKLGHAMKVVGDPEKQRQLLQVLFPNEYGGMSEGELQAATNSQCGVYMTAAGEKARKEAEEKIRQEMQNKEAAKEKEELKKADEVAAERFKRRAAMAELAPAAPSKPPTSAANFTMGDSGEAKRLRRAMAAAVQPAGRNQWGLPEAFVPPPTAEPSCSSSAGVPAPQADPNELWQRAGLLGLASSGWRRHESRNHPGKFYFLHEKTGKTVAQSSVQQVPGPALPWGWERRESRSKPGVFYYANIHTGETRVDPPVGGAPQQPSQLAQQSAQQQQLEMQQQQSDMQSMMMQSMMMNPMMQFMNPMMVAAQWAQMEAACAPPQPEPWPWDLVPDDVHLGQEEAMPARGNMGADLWPLVQQFIRQSGVDEQAAQALLASPIHVQRRIVEDMSLDGCSNPSAALTASIRRLMNGRGAAQS